MNIDEELRRRKEILDRLKKGPQNWNPEQATAEDQINSRLSGTAFDQINRDPRLERDQMDTLSRLGDISRDGYTMEEAAAMARARSEANRDDASRRASILQQMRMRGGGGGGAELAAQLASADSAAERESQASMDAAANGQRRQLQALLQRGQMAGQMSRQNFDEQSRQAEARDRLNEFNARVSGEFAKNRIDNANRAGQWNAGQNNDWNMKTSEIDYTDATQDMNRKIAEEQERQKRKAQKRSGLGGALGGIAGGVIGGIYGGPMGAGAGASVGQAAGSAIFSDERMKKDVDDADPNDFDDFIESIKPKNFNYKEGLQEAMRGDVQRDTSAAMDRAALLRNMFGGTRDVMKQGIPQALNDLHIANRIKDEKQQEVSSLLSPMAILRKLLDKGPYNQPERVGVMAQDIEGTPVGAMVVHDTPMGKVLDTDNLMGAVLGSIKRLDDKKRDK